MTKNEARTLYKQKRLSLSVSEKDRLEDLILINFQTLDLVIPDLIMTYAGNEKHMEYNPELVERYCSFKNPVTSFAFPRITEEGMEAIQVDEETEFIFNKFGIAEPIGGTEKKVGEIEMVFVPLLAFDNKGFRVGYGKGYYDRFLSDTSNEILKVGFSFFEAEENLSDTNQFDIPLDVCVTPFKTYHFN